MPLIICTIILIAIFTYEGFWYSAKAMAEAKKLRRYEEVEHPRSRRSDLYLDSDWV